MTNPKETAQQKPSSSEQQPPEKNSPQNDPSAEERTAQNQTNVTPSEKNSDEGDNVKMSEGGDSDGQEKIGKIKTNVTYQAEGSGGEKVKGHDTPRPADLENEKNLTPPFQGGQESGATAGGSSSSIAGRKRGRHGDVGSSSGSQARKKQELDAPSGAPTCYVCNRPFASWKAVFGHLRAHRREFPGAFPPPVFTPEGSPERKNIAEKTLKDQLAPTLLNLARETMQKMSQDSNTSAAAGASSSRSRGLEIDLNEPRTSVLLLDLNSSPPPEKDDEDEDNNKD
ncbi:hypothetical protein PTKIN_Ptkin08bG0205000 [Pterospermum kingtungense]